MNKTKNNFLIKLLSVVTVVIMFFNVITPNYIIPKSYAADEFTFPSSIGFVADVAGGILMLPLKYQILAIALSVQAIVSMAASAAGGEIALVDIQGILFHNASGLNNVEGVVKVDSVSIDFFGIDPANQSTVIASLAPLISKWYVAMRALAAISLLVVLIYIAIRMVISSSAGDKGKYKQMFTDWLVSFCLLFTMHYIMIGAVTINNAIISVMYEVNKAFNGNITASPLQDLLLLANLPTIKGFLYTIVYTVFVIYSLIFLVIYLKRMFMLAFLTVVAPIITITYSIDKVKDGKSQALDMWLKEYIYNVLVQPFDCLLYVVIVSFTMTLVKDNPIMALVAVGSMLPLRQWVAKFMGLDKASSASNAMAMMGAMWGAAQLGGKAVGSAKAGKKSTSNINKGPKLGNSNTPVLGQAIKNEKEKQVLTSGGADSSAAKVFNSGSNAHVAEGRAKHVISNAHAEARGIFNGTSSVYEAKEADSTLSKVGRGFLRGTTGVMMASTALTAPMLATAATLAAGGKKDIAMPAFVAAAAVNKEYGSMGGMISKKASNMQESISAKVDYVINGAPPKLNFADLKNDLERVVSDIQSYSNISDEQRVRFDVVARQASNGKDAPADLSDMEKRLFESVSNVHKYNSENKWESAENRAIVASTYNRALEKTSNVANLKPLKEKD